MLRRSIVNCDPIIVKAWAQGGLFNAGKAEHGKASVVLLTPAVLLIPDN
jgi:hypothetical protein